MLRIPSGAIEKAVAWFGFFVGQVAWTADAGHVGRKPLSICISLRHRASAGA
jgi:hypothetical protein